MPIYEFRCEKCGHQFEELVRNANDTNGLSCPSCKHQAIKKMVSTFASQIAGSSGSTSWGGSSGSCNTGST